MQRIDPASLPPAGRPSVHDSLNEDYRYCAARSSSPKKLQTTQWAGPSDSYLARKPEPIRPPTSTKPPPNKPDLFFSLTEVQGAQPNPFPGLSVHLPLQPTVLSEPSSPAIPWATSPSPLIPSCIQATNRAGSISPVLRTTNPLSPTYKWPTQPGAGKPYPMGAPAATPSCGGAPPSPSPQRVNHLDTAGLPGAHPSAMTRTRTAPYSSFDYSDATGPVSPTRARFLRDGRTQLPPHDARQLGLWGTSGDTGRMLTSHRPPTDPLAPVYHVHGATIRDDFPKGPVNVITARRRNVSGSFAGAGAGPGGGGGGGGTGRLPPASCVGVMINGESKFSVGAGQETVQQQGGGGGGIVDAMQGLARSNQDVRSPQRFGHAHNLAQLHVRKPWEVAPLKL